MQARTLSRPRRRDAERNRVRVLQTAREVFSVRGQRTSLDEVAGAAGLGVGTVHRAFGSRAGLVDALFEAELDDVALFIDECAAADSGWEALCRVLWGLTELQLRNRGLHDVVFGSVDEAWERVRVRIEPPLAQIVARAQREGRVRDDFTASDVAVLSRAVSGSRAAVTDHGMLLARRHVELLLKGIAATPDEREVPAPGESRRWQPDDVASPPAS